jgi:YYY domain-containing protein
MNAFFAWLIATTLIGWLAWPLSFHFFRRLPDRGYAFSKALGLLLFGYLFWFLGSLGFLRNDAGGLLLAAISLLALSILLVKRHGFAELRAWLRQHGTYVIAVELLFLLAFSGWAWMRAHNPDILGTEKPMEFMFINSILRSRTFPPHDAWLSGHAISYYYFGYLLVAAMARLTITPSPVAFNLSLAVLFALTAASAQGVTVNLIALVRRDRASHAQPPSSLMPAFWPALLGPLLILLVGNFYGVLELAHDNGLFASLRIPAVWYDFGNSPALDDGQSSQDFQGPPGARAGWINVWEWLDLKRLNTPPDADSGHFVWDLDNWFFAARVVHDRNLTGVETEAIDEMPAFSFVLGDLHPHVLALPFVTLATGLALDWLLWAREAAARKGKAPDRLPRKRLVLSGLILGGLAFLNTWDFPIYWFLVLLALLAGFASALEWHGFILHWRYLVKLAVSLLILSLALYFPFYLTFQSQAGGILPNLIYPTRFQQTVVMFGPVLPGVILFLGWLVLIWRKNFNLQAALLSGLGIVVLLSMFMALFVLVLAINPDNMGLLDQAIYPLTRDQALSLFWQRRLVDSLATLFSGGMIVVCVGLANGVLRQTESSPARSDPGAMAERPPQERESAHCELRSPAVLMSLAMKLTGALLILGPEFFYLRDNFGTRMNPCSSSTCRPGSCGRWPQDLASGLSMTGPAARCAGLLRG